MRCIGCSAVINCCGSPVPPVELVDGAAAAGVGHVDVEESVAVARGAGGEQIAVVGGVVG